MYSVLFFVCRIASISEAASSGEMDNAELLFRLNSKLRQQDGRFKETVPYSPDNPYR